VGDCRTVTVKGRREPVEVCEILGLEPESVSSKQ
jgi:hypothetical protein